MKKGLHTTIGLATILLFAACSDDDKTTAPPETPDPNEPQPVEIVIGDVTIEAITEKIEITNTDSETNLVSIDAIKGVTYANAMRFEHSELLSLSETSDAKGTIDATDFGDSCPQQSTQLPSSEDCLNLNIWRPSGISSDTKLPVYVYIHGGSFENGSGSLPNLSPDVVVAQSVIDTQNGDRTSPFMAITFNYRLGLLGSFWIEDNGDTKGGNFGIGDQKRALQWVSQNISELGGDPSNVTVYGQGSGAISINVMHQEHETELDPDSVDNAAPQYFQRSIMQSLPLGLPFRSYSLAKDSNETIIALANELFGDESSPVADLKSLSVPQILELQSKAKSQLTGRLFGLPDGVIENIVKDVIDGTSLAVIAVKYASDIAAIEPRAKMLAFAPYVEAHRECIRTGILGCREYADYDGYHVMAQTADTTLQVPSVIGFNSDESNPYTAVFKIPFLINLEILGFNIIDLILGLLSDASLPENIADFVPYEDDEDSNVNIPVYSILSTIWYLDNTSALSIADFKPAEDDTTISGAVENMSKFNNLNNNLLFKCAARDYVQQAVVTTPDLKTSLYHFDYISGFNSNSFDDPLLGALGSLSCFYGKPCNGAELPFILNKAIDEDGTALFTTTRDKKLMQSLSRLWFSDALFDDNPYTSANDNVLYIGVESEDIDVLIVEPQNNWDNIINTSIDPTVSSGICELL
ncbi:carboxylesterase family protein [Shewanella gaetbuli]|uniref:Carboxylesterase family protein n=1 Tax=Shewanella gaetbuli TaxID=220752 RepID=A0A9X1ZJB8_9GAMM|nr:carboxylesterase family protein [Shewanella gaetbuli]MCL1143384.1 carboxylesterase family protein [Shewanella gaetbuli]